jgi:tRNA(Arg) A34 adenosine deaminase TadA
MEDLLNPIKYLELAAQVSRLKDDDRTYFHGAVGIRKDGVIVASSNGNPKEPEPKHHAEARVLRKLGKGGILFVVRTLADGTWGDSRPCPRCWARIVSAKVDSVYWSASSAGWLGITVA